MKKTHVNKIHSEFPEVDPQTINEYIEQASKELPDNFMVIKFAWSDRFVFPYEDGLKIISAFKKSEELAEEAIIPNAHVLDVKILSREDYIHAKVRHLFKLDQKQSEEENPIE